MKIFQTIKFWLVNARYHSLVQSFWVGLISICIALNSHNFNFKFAILALFGSLLAHLSINLFDDYFDYKSGSVEKRKELNNSIRKGNCNYLENGKTTPKELLFCSCFIGLLALLIGFYLFLIKGFIILILTIIAGLLGLFYSAPPLKLSYRGLGEIIVGFMFGPLLMTGIYYCTTSEFNNQLTIISLAISALVTNILYVHSIMDEKADKEVNKKTLAVILKTKQLKVIGLLFFIIFPYWIITISVLYYNLPKLLLFIFITLPLNIYLLKIMIDFMNGNNKKYEPKFWMGKMDQWEKFKSIGIDWFMIRWFLARNIMTLSSIIICSAYIVKYIN